MSSHNCNRIHSNIKWPHLLSPPDLDTYREKYGKNTFNSNEQLQLEQGVTIVTDSITISSGPHAGPLLISPTNLDTYAYGIRTFNWNEQLQLEYTVTVVTDFVPRSSGPHAGPLLISPTNLDTWGKWLERAVSIGMKLVKSIQTITITIGMRKPYRRRLFKFI